MSETAASVRTQPDRPDPRRGRGGRRLRLIAPLAAAAAVAVVAGGVLLVQRESGTGSGGRPPTLHLVGTGGTMQADAEPKAPGDAGVAGVPGGSRYRAEGSLPDGPARGRVHTLPAGAAPKDAVARLAAGLGVSGTPVRSGDGWTVGSGPTALRVTDGSGWRWALGSGIGNTGTGSSGTASCHVIVAGKRACPPALPVGPGVPGPPGKVIPIQPPVAKPPDSRSGAGSTGGNVGSTSISAGGQPATGSGQPPNVGVPAPVDPPSTAPSPPADAVRKAAGPVLAALGLDSAAVRVDSYPALGLLTAAPVVDGLPTSGYETRLSYDLRMRLTEASGWLGTPAPGAEYPLVSATKALESVPVPAIALMPCADVQPSRCLPVQPVITGARPGLLLSWDEKGAALLVPAWLYDVRGWPTQLAAIAIDRGYLAPPVAPAPPPAPGAPTKIPPATGTVAPTR